MKNLGVEGARAKAPGTSFTILLVCYALLFGCSTKEQEQTSGSIVEATPAAAKETKSAVASGKAYAEPDCPATTSSTVKPSIHLVNGSLAIEDSCPLADLYNLVSNTKDVVVQVEYPSRVTDIVREGGKRESGPEVEFARFWEQHRSETEVGLVRLAAMLSATPPANGGTIDA